MYILDIPRKSLPTGPEEPRKNVYLTEDEFRSPQEMAQCVADGVATAETFALAREIRDYGQAPAEPKSWAAQLKDQVDELRRARADVEQYCLEYLHGVPESAKKEFELRFNRALEKLAALRDALEQPPGEHS